MIRRPRRSTRMTHSFPTRRSADLHDLRAGARKLRHLGDAGCGSEIGHRRGDAQPRCDRADARQFPAGTRTGAAQAMMGSSASESAYRVLMGVLESSTRSEEHTSELPSLMRISYAVFCLKNKISQNNTSAKIIKLLN